MRRFKQLVSEDETRSILCGATSGVLSLTNADGSPYGVPLSFAYDGVNSIYFHSAVSGQKIDCIAQDSRCSFCVIAQDSIVPEEFTTYFRSVIVSGTISVAEDCDEVMKGLLLLCEKYSPGIDSSSEIKKCINHVKILRLDIDGMTGKESIELVRKQKM